ncbi:unnamed protein product [Prorocentrum cordatum]|uniref:TFIIS central domain-containing protein n=1 Tax=Prorocentrum cordatum TaxID=2364126 RepID=A0ABN9SRG8_9DINO|nr:unnamed protein product [Polarella glacialis]
MGQPGARPACSLAPHAGVAALWEGAALVSKRIILLDSDEDCEGPSARAAELAASPRPGPHRPPATESRTGTGAGAADCPRRRGASRQQIHCRAPRDRAEARPRRGDDLTLAELANAAAQPAARKRPREAAREREPPLAAPGPSALEHRAEVQTLLAAALGGDARARALARDAEEALFQRLPEAQRYARQARAVLFNLRSDPRGGLREGLRGGSVQAASLAAMTSEDMSSGAKLAERARLRREALEATTLKQDQQLSTSDFTCEKCSGTAATYSQSMATESCIRSGGEPVMTAVTFVTCSTCGFQWTERSGFA